MVWLEGHPRSWIVERASGGELRRNQKHLVPRDVGAGVLESGNFGSGGGSVDGGADPMVVEPETESVEGAALVEPRPGDGFRTRSGRLVRKPENPDYNYGW